MIFIRYPFQCDLKVLHFETTDVSVHQIEDDIGSFLGSKQFLLFYNGKKLQNDEVLPDNSTVHVTFSLPGGKGGFGSMLRAIGAQIEKTTNREACRDLSGRRLRDINEEQRLKKWISKEAEREAEKIKRRQARIERLKTKAPHKFFDFEYEKEISELPERIDEALTEGLQKAKQPEKRSHEDSDKATKLPNKSWLGDDFPNTSSDSDSDETNTANEVGPSKKMKTMSKEGSSCESDFSESSLSYPGSSKDPNFITEESSSSNSKTSLRQDQGGENITASEKMDVVEHEGKSTEDQDIVSNPDTKNASMEKNELQASDCTAVDKDIEKRDESAPESSNCTTVKEPEVKDDSPIDLLDFQSVSDLEALGLDRLKSALMMRGLKCGGALSDRAQRLWKVRGLQPSQYPTNLLAKSKK